jgi:hypothetical protein
MQDLTGQKITTSLFPADWSFIKVGSKGAWKDQPFEVIGRVKLQLLNSYKNAWYILYDNGTSGWLFDWLGNLAIGSAYKKDFDFEDIIKLRPGKSINIHENSCEIVCMEECERVMYEGELGNWKHFKRGIFVADGVLYNQASIFFLIDIPKKEIIYLEAGKASLENLKLETVTQWDEWR